MKKEVFLTEKSPIRVLVVGHLPPPPLGQMNLNAYLVRAKDPRISLIPIRLNLSPRPADFSKIQLRKIFRLLTIAAQIVGAKLRYRPHILLYPPGGNRSAVYRDLLLLLPLRRLFPKTIFFLHQFGVNSTVSEMPRLLQPLCRAMYRNADTVVYTTGSVSPETEIFGETRFAVVPPGVPDEFDRIPGPPQGRPHILYLNAMNDEKGVMVLLDALEKLLDRGIEFFCDFAGPMLSEDFSTRFWQRIRSSPRLEQSVRHHGSVEGEAKRGLLGSARVVCVPTHHPTETCPIVALEALMAGKPVVASAWRGLKSTVADGQTGYLVPVHDSQALADRLGDLLLNEVLAQEMGRRGRIEYLNQFRMECYQESVMELIRRVAEGN